jgi:hypothetical protein
MRWHKPYGAYPSGRQADMREMRICGRLPGLLTEVVTQHREEIRMPFAVDIVRPISFVKQPVTRFCAFLARLEVAGIAILDNKRFLVGIAWIDSAVTFTATM